MTDGQVETIRPTHQLTSEDIENQARAKGRRTFGIYNIADIESKKFWLMSISFTLMGLIYSIARELKDVFVIERQDPSSIQFLKVFGIFPAAGAIAAYISQQLQYKTNIQILKMFILIYIAYFAIFSLVIFPFGALAELNPFRLRDLFSDKKMKFFGLHFIQGPLMCFTTWTSTLNFIAAEIWGTTVFILLFLSVANDVCPFQQFVRFVPLFYIGSNIGLMSSGGICYGFTKLTNDGTYAFRKKCTIALTGSLSILCVGVYFLIVSLEKYLINDPYPSEKNEKKSKPKLSVGESLKIILTSKVCIAVCITVLGYNITTNIIEACFKAAMANAADAQNRPRGEVVMSFNSIQQITIGVTVCILLCTPFKTITKTLGWRFVGLITPVCALLSSLTIFGFATFNTFKAGETPDWMKGFLSIILPSFDMNLQGELWAALIAVSCIKIFKYAAFDICKELFTMKIDKEYRARYKGVYDGFCGKMGKAGGSLYSLIVLAAFGVTDCRAAGPFGIIFASLIGAIWVHSVLYLARKYDDALKRNDYIKIE